MEKFSSLRRLINIFFSLSSFSVNGFSECWVIVDLFIEILQFSLFHSGFLFCSSMSLNILSSCFVSLTQDNKLILIRLRWGVVVLLLKSVTNHKLVWFICGHETGVNCHCSNPLIKAIIKIVMLISRENLCKHDKININLWLCQDCAQVDALRG